jgi:hypothetical protein
MQAIKVTCPLCQGVTGVKGTSPLGQNVHCQRCGAPFTVAADDIRRANLELAESCAVGVPAAIAQPQASAPWWVDTQATQAPARPAPMPVRMGVLATAPSAAQEPATLTNAAACQATLKSAPVAVAATGNPRAAVPQAPAASGANRLVALGLLGGGMLLILGAGVALGVICLVDPSSEEENAAQTSPLKTTKKPLLPTDKQPPGQPAAPQEPKQPDPELEPNPDPQPAPRPHPRRPGEEVVEKDPPQVPKGKDPLVQQPKDVKQPPGNKHVVSPAKQKEIDKAIENGVKYLKGNYKGDGTWGFGTGHELGTTALSAMVLMECGVPPKDPCIVGAANYVRKHWKDNRATYEIALAILFLDKLGEKVGDKKDKGIITALALRLIHTQNNVGGWSYNCQILTPTEATALMTALKKNRPKFPTLITKDPVTVVPVSLSLPDQIRMLNPLEKASGMPLPSAIDKSKPGEELPETDKTKPTGPPSSSSKGPGTSGGLDAPFEPDNAPKNPGEKAQAVPAQQPAKGAAAQPPKGPKDKGPKGVVPNSNDDNSNTQFAILALWAARRYDVPVEKALLLAEQRYATSQHASGGWGYKFNAPNDTPSMTCVGLLGLAVGKGVNAEMKIKAGHKDFKMSLLDDRAKKGLAVLGPHLEKRAINAPNFPPGLSLYYMWSLERVGVLYDLVKIGDREWYLWGVDILLPTQRPVGSWETGSYHGSNPTIDTCFALLFLKRVNFVQDLTDLTLPTLISESNPLPK